MQKYLEHILDNLFALMMQYYQQQKYSHEQNNKYQCLLYISIYLYNTTLCDKVCQ